MAISDDVEDRWMYTFGYLRRHGIEPELMSSDGYDNLGYESFVPDGRGGRLYGPAGVPIRERYEWPKGFSWIDFVTCIQDDNQYAESANARQD